jgi:hypothetical protein
MDARNALARSGRPYPRTQVWGRGWQRMLTGWLTQARWSVLGRQPARKRGTTAGRTGHRAIHRNCRWLLHGLLTSDVGSRRSGVRVSPSSRRGVLPRAPRGAARVGLTTNAYPSSGCTTGRRAWTADVIGSWMLSSCCCQNSVTSQQSISSMYWFPWWIDSCRPFPLPAIR